MDTHGTSGWASRFFGVIARRQTWLNLAYLIIAFPLGLVYFVFIITGMSIGLGLAILWVGIPILLIVMGAWWAFAALERLLARGLLGLDCGFNPRPWEDQTGALSKLRAHLTDGSTWRSLAFVLLKFPLGVASFALTVAVLATAQWLLFAPLWILSTRSGDGYWLWSWQVDSAWEAAPLIPLGVLALFVGLHLLNGVATVWRYLADALLVEPEPSAPAPDAFATGGYPPAGGTAQPGPYGPAGGGPQPPATPYGSWSAADYPGQPQSMAPQPAPAQTAPQQPPAPQPGTPQQQPVEEPQTAAPRQPMAPAAPQTATQSGGTQSADRGATNATPAAANGGTQEATAPPAACGVPPAQPASPAKEA
jgi:hypothetical protein